MTIMKKLMGAFAVALFGAGAAQAAEAVSFLAWDAETKTLVSRTCTEYEVVNSTTVPFENGKWYVVNSTVSRGNIFVDGTAHLILADDGDLTLAGSVYGAGLTVNDGNKLTIYGQAAGTGKLTTTSEHGAGIGGNYNTKSGEIVINGGTIVAKAGWSSAGIGGGHGAGSGPITIHGGNISAYGSGGAAGIGGGYDGACESVTITGGYVFAQGAGGADIGGGIAQGGTSADRRDSGAIEITGGTVIADGFEPMAKVVYDVLAKTLTFTYDSCTYHPEEGVRLVWTDLTSAEWTNENKPNAYEATTVIVDPSFAAYRPTSTAKWFYRLGQIKELDLTALNLSETTDMSWMFYLASSLKTIYVSDKIKIVKCRVENTFGMFDTCVDLVGEKGTAFSWDVTPGSQWQYAQVDGEDFYGTGFSKGYYSRHHAAVDFTLPGLPTDLKSVVVYQNNAQVGTASGRYDAKTGDVMTLVFTAADGYRFTDGTKTTIVKVEPLTGNLIFDYSRLMAREPIPARPVGVVSGTTLTLYFDALERSGTVYEGENWGKWIPEGSRESTLQKIVIDPSFAAARLTTTKFLFFNLEKVTEIAGLEYLNTSSVTNMDYMFAGMSSLTNIVVGETFVTNTVTSSTGMFEECWSLEGALGTTINECGILGADATYARADLGALRPGLFTPPTPNVAAIRAEDGAITPYMSLAFATAALSYGDLLIPLVDPGSEAFCLSVKGAALAFIAQPTNEILLSFANPEDFLGETIITNAFDIAIDVSKVRILTDGYSAFGENGNITLGLTPDPNVTVTIGDLEHMSAVWTSGDGSITNMIEGTSFEVLRGTEYVKVIFTADKYYDLTGEEMYEIGTAMEDVDISAFVPTAFLPPVAYLAWDATNKVLTNAVCTVCELVTEDTETFENGKWYVVKGIVSRDTIWVNGTANLILADGAKLSVAAPDTDTQAAGLNVSRGNALTIYAQEAGTGALDAIGGYWAAGIGGGRGESAGNVTIRGGAVTARAGEKIPESTIGRGYGNSTSDGRTVISGGIFGMTIRMTWLESGFGVIENPDAETAAAYPWKVVGACKVTVGNHDNVNVKWTSGDGSVTNDVSGTSFAIDTGLTNVKMIFAPAEGFVLVGENEYELGTVTTDVDITAHVPTAVLEPVSYLAWDAEERTTTNAVCTVCEPVTAETTTLEDGKWYAVRGEVSRGMIAAHGSVHLILCDGAKLTVKGGNFEPGLSVAGQNALTIYGQEGNSGELSASGGNDSAGIGGGFKGSCGTVTIHGGRVKARGVDVADIGPGSESSMEGTIAITGGLFGMTVESDWLAELCEVVDNQDEQSKGAYPYLVRPIPMVTVTVGELQNLTARWTCGDGMVTNALEATSFEVLRGTENVTILFTPDEGYEFFTSDKAELGTVLEDLTLLPAQIPVAYRKGDFAAHFVQTGNGVGRIEIADHGLSRKINIAFPVTDGEVSRTYTSDLSGRSTNLTFGVIFVDDNDSVVLPKDSASNPSYLNKDDKIKAFPGRYLPKDIKVKGDTITLYNYGREFKVDGIDVVTESNKKEKKESLVDGIIDFLKNSDHSGGGKSWTFFISVFGTEELAISFITEYVDVFVEEFVDEINDVMSTLKKLKKMLEMLDSIITRLSATVYIGDGEKDGDYYTAAKAPDAFNKVAGSSTVVHFMRNARTPAYTATKKLTIDMHGAPKVDVTALSDLIDGIDFGEGTPDFVKDLIKKMVEEAIDLGGSVLQSATAVDHVSAQSDGGTWLTVAEGAAVTISNFNPEGGSVGSDLSTSLIAVNSGSLTLNKVTMMNYNVSDKRAIIRVNDGAALMLTETCKITGGNAGNVFVAPTATLTVNNDASRVGISGQTEDGDAFAVTKATSYSAHIYTNDAHPGDAGYSIVAKDGHLYWLYTHSRDPDDPDFPTPGEQSDGVALNIRLIMLSDGTQVARLWGAPENGEKGAWYYLEVTSDLKGEFKYLSGYKWKASKDGAVAEMQQGADRSCCDVPTKDVKNRFFRFRSQRYEPQGE